MLETLVSSRIRRALFEYLLTHPQDRFYLRGLAKELGLSVSPLRRELKRLERAGLLTAMPEGNLLFYTANAASPAFRELQQAGGRLLERPPAQATLEVSQPLPAAASPVSTAVEFHPQPTSIGVMTTQHRSLFWSSPLSGPALIGAAGVGMALFLIVAGLVYLTLTNHQLATKISHTLTIQKPEVTVVVPHTSSGTMRGARWQVVPGGLGGFSSGSSSESY